MNNFQQHFLKNKNIKKIKLNIDKIHINNNNIIEIGIGTGQFTKCFYRKKMKLSAFEIDKNLKYDLYKNKKNFKNIKIFFKPFILEDTYKFKKQVIISAPPYSLLEQLSKVLEKYKIKYILMVGERYLKFFKTYRIIYQLNGNDFIPQSTGKHYIITNIN